MRPREPGSLAGEKRQRVEGPLLQTAARGEGGDQPCHLAAEDGVLPARGLGDLLLHEIELAHAPAGAQLRGAVQRGVQPVDLRQDGRPLLPGAGPAVIDATHKGSGNLAFQDVIDDGLAPQNDVTEPDVELCSQALDPLLDQRDGASRKEDGHWDAHGFVCQRELGPVGDLRRTEDHRQAWEHGVLEKRAEDGVRREQVGVFREEPRQLRRAELPTGRFELVPAVLDGDGIPCGSWWKRLRKPSRSSICGE